MQTGPNAGATIYGGSLSALDPATGNFVWQGADPASFIDPATVLGFPEASFVPLDSYLGPPTSVNGIVFQGAMLPTNAFYRVFFGFDPGLPAFSPNLHAFSAADGSILWSHASELPIISGVTVANGRAYVGTGFLQDRGKLLQFGLPNSGLEDGSSEAEFETSHDQEEDR